MRTTWRKPSRAPHGDLDTDDDRDKLPDSAYAFSKQRKQPLTDASHVRNALAPFDQVQDVSDTDRELAFANIKRRQGVRGRRGREILARPRQAAAHAQSVAVATSLSKPAIDCR